MSTRRRRLTLGRMMAAIGVAALFCATLRVEAAPAVGVCIVVACAWYLTSRRFAETMAWREAEGLTTGRSQTINRYRRMKTRRRR